MRSRDRRLAGGVLVTLFCGMLFWGGIWNLGMRIGFRLVDEILEHVDSPADPVIVPPLMVCHDQDPPSA